MFHSLMLLVLIHLFPHHIGTAHYCAFDGETRQWECNYNTPSECLAYNEYCGERYQ